MNKGFRDFVVFVVVVIVASVTNAQTMPSAAALEAERKTDLEALRPLSESEGLTPEEFQYRDGILIKVAMSLPQTFNEQVKSDPAYAASWVQHQPKPVRYITFAGVDGYKRGKALVDKLASEFGGFWVDYVEVRKATISERELNKLRDRVELLLRTKGIDFRSNTGHDDNRQDSHVLIETQRPAKEVRELIGQSGINLKFIKVQQVPEFAKPMANLYGGFGMAPTSAGSPNCTSGFAAITSSGVRGVLTAGHCDPNVYYAKGDGTVWRNIPFFKEAFSGSYDVQFHTASAFTVSNKVLGEPSARVTGSFDANQQEIGYVACKYGLVTGKTCGKITTKTDTHPKFPTAKTYIRVTCSAGVICAKRGDSGAPVYFKPQGLNILVAAGILSGGDDVYNTFFYYMPINYISVIGVGLIYEPWS